MDLNDPNIFKEGTCRNRLSNEERHRIVEHILTGLNKNGKPNYGIISEVATKFNVSRRTVGSIWKIAAAQKENGEPINVKAKLPGIVGRKPKTYDLSRLTEIPLNRRTNIRALSSALGFSKSTTHNLVKQGLIRSHSNAIKPLLNEDNKKKRVEFCLSKLEPNNTNSTPKFEKMDNCIHIDEKWFYMTKVNQHYYLHQDESDPLRCCKSKGFIGKVMFLCAVARPEFDENGEVLFDGKIGIFPFIEMVPAKRNSKNRSAGTMEVKPIESITKEVIRAFMVNKVIPAIKDKWPSYKSKQIYIQQDNARPHISPDDAMFVNAASQDGFDIRLTYQPPNSPDLNVLDLGWFRAIQTIQHELAPRSVEELVNVVQLAFDQLKPKSLNYVWLSLQGAMSSILESNGCNNYKVPHMAKERLAREGNLPHVLEVTTSTLEVALNFLSNQVG